MEIKVTNDGEQPAYWLHLKPALSIDGILRLDPPDRQFKGKGKQEWRPDRIARLESGETALLFARISPNLKLPSDLIQCRNGILIFRDVISHCSSHLPNFMDIPTHSTELAIMCPISRAARLFLVIH